VKRSVQKLLAIAFIITAFFLGTIFDLNALGSTLGITFVDQVSPEAIESDVATDETISTEDEIGNEAEMPEDDAAEPDTEQTQSPAEESENSSSGETTEDTGEVPEENTSGSTDDDPVNDCDEPPTEENNDAQEPEAVDPPGPRQFPPQNIGDFYFAYLDFETDGSVKTVISGLVLRFVGTIESIDPSLLTDVVLTRDEVPVENGVMLTGRKEQYQLSNTDITDFFFKFDNECREPGVYRLTGKYNGEAFKVYEKCIEAPIDDTPANPDGLYFVSWCFRPDEQNQAKSIKELSFFFYGAQNTFCCADVTELLITRNGEALPYSFKEKINRYYEYYDYMESYNTSYHLVLNEEFTQSGTYVATGYYRGIPFTSMEITIP